MQVVAQFGPKNFPSLTCGSQPDRLSSTSHGHTLQTQYSCTAASLPATGGLHGATAATSTAPMVSPHELGRRRATASPPRRRAYLGGGATSPAQIQRLAELGRPDRRDVSCAAGPPQRRRDLPNPKPQRRRDLPNPRPGGGSASHGKKGARAGPLRRVGHGARGAPGRAPGLAVDSPRRPWRRGWGQRIGGWSRGERDGSTAGNEGAGSAGRGSGVPRGSRLARGRRKGPAAQLQETC
jgi:hypothetical protein